MAANITTLIQNSLRECLGNINIIHPYMAINTSPKLQAVVRDACLKGIVGLVYTLHLMVRDALGLRSTVKPTWDAAALELRSLLKTCQCLAVHFS